MIYTQRDAHDLQEALSRAAMYARVTLLELGGAANASLCIAISLDKREDWSYGILENSRHAKLMAHSRDGKLIHLAGHGVAKLRKCKVGNVEDIRHKLVNWIYQNSISTASKA